MKRTQGASITSERRRCAQERVEVCPTDRLTISAALSRKEPKCEHSAGVIKAAVANVLAGRK